MLKNKLTSHLKGRNEYMLFFYTRTFVRSFQKIDKKARLKLRPRDENLAKKPFLSKKSGNFCLEYRH